MKKQFLIISLLFVESNFCVDEKKSINDYLLKTKQTILGAHVKKMSTIANSLNDKTRSVIKDILGDDVYKEYRKNYVTEETARWHAGTHKVKDKKLSKDEKTLANALLKTRNKLELIARENYGNISVIVKKLSLVVKDIIQKNV